MNVVHVEGVKKGAFCVGLLVSKKLLVVFEVVMVFVVSVDYLEIREGDLLCIRFGKLSAAFYLDRKSLVGQIYRPNRRRCRLGGLFLLEIHSNLIVFVNIEKLHLLRFLRQNQLL
jgi:hypothetical protein